MPDWVTWVCLNDKTHITPATLSMCNVTLSMYEQSQPYDMPGKLCIIVHNLKTWCISFLYTTPPV